MNGTVAPVLEVIVAVHVTLWLAFGAASDGVIVSTRSPAAPGGGVGGPGGGAGGPGGGGGGRTRTRAWRRTRRNRSGRTSTSIEVDVVSSPSDAVIFPVRSPLHSVVPCPVLSVRTVVEVSWPVDVVNVTVASRTPPPPADSTST